jgi:F-type H+-transporting ATPase subunit a
MPEQLPFTALLNRIFAGPVDALLRALHIEPKFSQAPIPNATAMEVLVVGFLILVFLLLRARLSVENPGGIQHIFEGLHGFITQQSREIIGHHSESFTPYLMALGLFILTCNLIGLIPALESPTADKVVPLGLAVSAFFYYNAQGVLRHGAWKYAKHFIPIGSEVPLLMRIPLSAIMLVIEIISNLARMLSLTVRLYANMFAGDMVTLVFFSLVPIGVPVIFMGLHIAVSFLQAYIFVLLTTVYLSGAVATEH